MTKEQNYEYVSAAMDDELTEEALDKLLQDSEAQQKWNEYHLIRDYLQSTQRSSMHQVDMQFDYVTVKTEKAKAVKIEEPISPANSIFKGFAIAASILAVAVIGWQMLPLHTGEVGSAEVANEQSLQLKSNDAVVPVAGVAAKGEVVKPTDNTAPGVVVPNAAQANEPSAEAKPAIQVEKPGEVNTLESSGTSNQTKKIH